MTKKAKKKLFREIRIYLEFWEEVLKDDDYRAEQKRLTLQDKLLQGRI